MARKKAGSDETSLPPADGSEAAKNALRDGVSRIEEMHRSIAAQSFGLLQGTPLAGAQAQFLRQMHDSLAASAYAAFRQGSGSMLDLAGALARQAAVSGNLVPDFPARFASQVRSALNAAFGDQLAGADHALAIVMGLYRDGQPVAMKRQSLASRYPATGDRLCLFLHGLGHDEQCWAGEHGEIDIPARLAADGGYTPLLLRYNTGLPIVENGAQLAVLLEELVAAWPGPLAELVIVGHSMGGLVARSATAQAAACGLRWPGRVRMIVCLGSPDIGTSLEKWGELAATARRLAGVDLPPSARGRAGHAKAQPGNDLATGGMENIAWRFIGGSLAEDPDDPLGEIIGDGLVTLGSATSHELEGDVDSVRLGGVSHMGLLGDRRVFGQICKWLGVKPGAKPKRRSAAA